MCQFASATFLTFAKYQNQDSTWIELRTVLVEPQQARKLYDARVLVEPQRLYGCAARPLPMNITCIQSRVQHMANDL